jgi:hypothetical protein
LNKYVQPRPYANPEAAARKIIELAHAFEPVQDGRIYVEVINGPFLFQHKGTPAEHSADLSSASSAAGQVLHESGTFVKFTQAATSSRRRRTMGPCTTFGVSRFPLLPFLS